MAARLALFASSLPFPAIALAQATAAGAPKDPAALDVAWIVAGAAILVFMIAPLVGPGVLHRARARAGASAHRRVREGA